MIVILIIIHVSWHKYQSQIWPSDKLLQSLQTLFFSCRTAVWQTASFLLVKTQFCRTVLYVIIVILEIFARHLSDRIKYFFSQNEISLVLTDRPALFVKTVTSSIFCRPFWVFKGCLDNDK